MSTKHPHPSLDNPGVSAPPGPSPTMSAPPGHSPSVAHVSTDPRVQGAASVLTTDNNPSSPENMTLAAMRAENSHLREQLAKGGTSPQELSDLRAENSRLRDQRDQRDKRRDPDITLERVGVLYPHSEREARLLGRDEQVMLSAVALAIVKVLAEDDGKEATPEFIVEYVKRAREPFMERDLNPQPLGGNEVPK